MLPDFLGVNFNKVHKFIQNVTKEDGQLIKLRDEHNLGETSNINIYGDAQEKLYTNETI